MIRVVVTGYTGKVGSVVYRYLQNQSDMEVVAGFNSSNLKGLPEVIRTDKPHFLVDFTLADVALDIIKTAAEYDVNVITGTTGFQGNIDATFSEIAKSHNIAIAWVPNFSLGANLMMEFSKRAAEYFDEAEIVEMHHRTKRDKPSGTAKLTASLIRDVWRARGIDSEIIPSSLRLSSAVAHQWVLFSGEDEFLVIEHHSLSRLPFAKGVAVALRKLFSKLDEVRGRYLKGLSQILEL